MNIFLDTSNLREIEKYLDMGVIDGVTTNPTILLKDKIDPKELANLIKPLPLSLEVTTNDFGEAYMQARQLAQLSPNIVVKIPQENQDGEPFYGIIDRLEDEGIHVNATVAMSFGQVILSAKVGATYISIFAGRIGDEGGNVSEVIKNSVDWLKRWNYDSQIIVGSIRSVADVLQAAIVGAHVITVPPDILAKMADHKFARETVRQFIADSKK